LNPGRRTAPLAIGDGCLHFAGGLVRASQQKSATHVRLGSMLLKKSFSTADQNFSRPLMRFSDKYVRDLVS
jgi:hypothetical protein